ncbi:MAG: carboxyltransferase domain-containing protein, partial [Thermoanaerobaculia bacterium]
MASKILPAGDRGLLVRMRGMGLATLVAKTETARAESSVAAAIPGDDGVLLLFPAGLARDVQLAVAERVARVTVGRSHPSRVRHHIPVSFADEHAPDLPRLLEAAGIDRAAFLDMVAGLELRVRFLGFRPGFAYLEGVPDAWQLPRLATPRQRVPAGSFAVAGARAGIYPEASPGGWNLLGRTDAVLWDRGRERPNLFVPGDEVKIVPSDRPLEAPRVLVAANPGEAAVLEVLRAGSAMHLVDVPDFARTAWGLPVGGPFDSEAAAVANRNAGNPADAPLVECALSGPCLRATARVTLAWSGARAPIRRNGRPIGDPRRIDLEPGDELDV